MNDTPEPDEMQNSQKPTPPLPPPPDQVSEPASDPTSPPPPAATPPPLELIPAPPKSPPLAAFLSVLFPGLGHLYCWSYERAFMIWVALTLSVFMIVNGWWPMSFFVAFIYFFSIFDSYREAQCFELDDQAQRARPTPSGDGRLMFGVFLAVAAAVVLVDKFDLFDLYWLFDWWPVPVLLVGVYFIVAALRERIARRAGSETYDDGFGDG